jgi:hypothetical protein
MKVKKNRSTKKRGPKPNPDKPPLPVRQLRMSETQAAAVGEWAERQPDQPNWSEAVRQLIELGLKAKR